MFRQILVFSLVFLLLTEESDAWRRRWRRVGRAVRRIGKAIGKAAKVVGTVKTAVAVAKTAAALGKRSIDDNVITLNFCNFSSFDLNDDDIITESEISTLIEMTAAVDLDQFFELIDINKDGEVTPKEYNNSNIIMENCVVR
ncbi:EF-hand calcium-binding domain-containing protein 1-like [Saccostrea echinata]|uniref:EF-hand calcium-binding domain-containing protein 1-like n=1 Tax=Saccostrea echinata TaxID=191078 RepID=UPI002A80FCD1|nr:EF-hand calcium-binding domain-containing protein 1-like [Saccostrea echinata]